MHFLIGTLIVLAIIYFMIVSPGFRAAALILLAICGVGIFLIIENSEKQTKQRQQQQAEEERRATNSIRSDDLLLSGISLVKDQYGGGWTLQGTITNNSKFDLGRISFRVTIQDCPNQVCKIIGQETTSTISAFDQKSLVPAGQVRLFKTYRMKFENMPPATASRWDYTISTIRAAF